MRDNNYYINTKFCKVQARFAGFLIAGYSG